MIFKPVDECYDDGLYILMMKDGTVKWSSRENAHFNVPNQDGISHQRYDTIVYAALVAVELPEEVVYDSIWKYAPTNSYRYAVLEKDATIRYFQNRPRRMPDGSYMVDEQLQNRSMFNACYSIKDAKLVLDPNYEPGTLVER